MQLGALPNSTETWPENRCGAGAAVVMLKANTEAMQHRIDEISLIVRPGAHAVILLDGAAWHTANALK